MSSKDGNDDASLIDLVNMLRRYKLLLLGLPFIFLAIASLYVSIALRPMWEATVILDVGRISGAPVEPVVNTITRMKLPSFAKEALNLSTVSPGGLTAAEALYNNMKVSQVPAGDLIKVQLRASSSEMAGGLMAGAVAYVQKYQSELMADDIELVKKRIQVATEDIKSTNLEIDLLKKQVMSSHNWTVYDATVTANLLQSKITQYREMVQKKIALEEELSQSHTHTARTIGNISVSDGPVSPKKFLISIAALLLGLMVAVVVAYVHHAMQGGTTENIDS